MCPSNFVWQCKNRIKGECVQKVGLAARTGGHFDHNLPYLYPIIDKLQVSNTVWIGKILASESEMLYDSLYDF